MYLYNEHAWKKMSVRKKLKYVHCKYVYWPLSLFNPINWRIHFIRLSTTWTHVLRMLSRSGVKLITFLLQGRTLPMAILVVEFQVTGIHTLPRNELLGQLLFGGSSKRAPRILIFSLVLGAKYSFYLKSIATYAPQKVDIIIHS